jgi:hypothetical protein
VNPGNYRIRVQKERYQTALQPVAVSESVPEVEVRLSDATRASVRMVNARDGSPISGSVSATDAAGKAAYTTQVSGADGVAPLWLAPGHYTIHVYAHGFAPAIATVDVPGPETLVQMTPGGRVIVTVRGTATAVRTRLTSSTGMTLWGPGRFESVPPGSYIVSMMGPDQKPGEGRPVVVQEGQTVTVDFP